MVTWVRYTCDRCGAVTEQRDTVEVLHRCPITKTLHRMQREPARPNEE
jgi:hypothetical protein